MTHRPIITLLLSLLLLSSKALSQSLPDTTIARIDQLLSKWNTSSAPGCAAGIIRDTQLIYAKGFGLANLETNTPITPSTVFYMCSVSKQFTGYAIAMLVNDGRINLDEKIQTYLPWLSDFGGQHISVRHLLHHTSGIRDDIWLSDIYGLGLNGMLTEDQAIRLLQKQRTLNFTPGEKFSYSNSNYVLLAEIIKAVTGKTLAAYADSAIFKPLGMNATAFVDDPATLIPNRALSYENGKNALQNVYTLGDGGLFTSVNDMARWAANFLQSHPRAGTTQDITLMTTPGKLNDSSNITYAMGIDILPDRRNQRFIHNGGLAGYRTLIMIYPEYKLGFFIFGNGGDGDISNKLNQIAALLIPDHSEKKDAPEYPIIQIKHPDQLSKLSGTYVAANGYKVTITYKDEKLYLNGNAELAPEAENIFHLVARPAVKYTFTNHSVSLVSPVLTQALESEKIKEVALSPTLLAKYTGRYWSDEVEAWFIISLRNNKLWIHDKYHEPVEITLAGTEHLFTGYDFLAHLMTLRDKNGVIKGLELHSGNNANLNFYKTKM